MTAIEVEQEKPLVLENLTEEEAYLFCILTDPSGLDQAEFLWHDPSVQDHLVCATCGSSILSVHKYKHPLLERERDGDPDPNWVRSEEYAAPSNCWRAWAFQWQWWRNTEPQQIDQCARSVGKSLSIKARGCAFPFVHPNQEMVITAPELVHLEPIVTLIEDQMTTTRLYREMLPRGKSAVTHRPFQMNFLNGSRIIGRIPQITGRGVKGIHPIWLELDEAQDYPKAGWKELVETLKIGFAGAVWRAHGVTRGIRDDFYDATQDTPDNQWRVHRFPAMWRPNWTPDERSRKIKQYGGSEQDPDYRRNVLGLHGDKTNPIFVLQQLMKNVDADPLSDYNTAEYYQVHATIEKLEMHDDDMIDVLDFPARHLSYAGTPEQRLKKPKAIYWAGMDVGFTVDPSEILVFVEYREKEKDPYTRFKLLTRIQMMRMPRRQQVLAILKVIDFYRPKVFGMEKGGNAHPLYQEIADHLDSIRTGQRDRVPPEILQFEGLIEHAVKTTIKGYNFSEKLITNLDDAVELEDGDDPEKAAMRRNAKEYGTDVLREWVDNTRMWLPWDKELLDEFNGATWTSTKGFDHYGKKRFSSGNDHCLDAARFAALGQSLNSIDELLKPKEQVAVLDRFGF